ncbi:hypothetical protein GCM10010219_12180 [Streptomyces netropsis]|nr:hypothetical protein GCM10010219_12180 [Streptomyces netropsis]
MGTRPPLVGLVTATRSIGSLNALVGAVGSLPVAFGNTGGFGVPVTASLAVVIFGLPFAWSAGPRRAWYRTRLDQASPVPPGSPVTAREGTFEAVSRAATAPLVLGLGIGLLIAYTTGIPVGLALVGLGGGLLHQARWLAGQERELGSWLVCPLAPFQVRADDPARSTYLEAPFYTVPAE